MTNKLYFSNFYRLFPKKLFKIANFMQLKLDIILKVVSNQALLNSKIIIGKAKVAEAVS